MMISPALFCGSRSFSNVDDGCGAPATPRRARKRDGANPYSARGREKFATVVAELEARRQKIMAQMGPQEIPLVRFVYSGSDDWVPVVVKPKSPQQGKGVKIKPSRSTPAEAPQKSPVSKQEIAAPVAAAAAAAPTPARRGLWGKGATGGICVAALVLILLCLALFGRSFAVICTSIWWYMVPVLRGDSPRKKTVMKKHYARMITGKKMEASSPRFHQVNSR